MGSRSPGRWRGRSIVAGVGLVMALILLAPTATVAQTITPNIAGDEHFIIGTGGYTGIVAGVKYVDCGGGLPACSPGHLKAQMNALPVSNTDFFYIVAASNNAATNGVLADFAASTRVTGVGPWSVCATGVEWDPGVSPILGAIGGPAGTINGEIAACNTGGRAAGTTSVQWVSWYDFGGGVRAIGEYNTGAGPDFIYPPLPAAPNAGGISSLARWMWFDDGVAGGPFTNAGQRKEFYIFRIPVVWILANSFVTLEKDYHNTSLTPATSIEWTISGCANNIMDFYNGPYVRPNGTIVAGTTYGPPTVNCVGGNTLVEWTAVPAIPSGGKAHVGFTVAGTSSVTTVSTTMDPNGLLVCRTTWMSITRLAV